jgi:hypothetical protein
MDNHPAISCSVCSKPVDLRFDLCTDEDGQAVHEECYVSRLLAEHANQTVAENLLGILSVQPLSLGRSEMRVGTVAQ